MDSNLNEVLSEQATPAAETPAPETTQPEPQQEPTGEEVSASPAQPQDDPIETHRKGLNAAVTAERQRRQAAEQRAAALEAEVRQVREQLQPKPQAAPEDQAPDPQNYTDANQYWSDVAEYKAKVAAKQAVQQYIETHGKQQAQQQAQAAWQQATTATIKAGQAEFPDFDPAMDSLAPFITPQLHQAIVQVKGGHKVAYYLAKNPAEAARVAQLDPVSMLAEFGELRAKAVAAAPKQSIPQTLTHARDARGQFAQQRTDEGPTPLDAILKPRKV